MIQSPSQLEFLLTGPTFIFLISAVPAVIFIVLKLINFKDEKIKNIVLSILAALMSAPFIFYLNYLVQRGCSFEGCLLGMYFVVPLLAIIAIPFIAIIIYFLMKKLRRMIFNIYTVVTIVTILLGLISVYYSYMSVDRLAQKAAENNNPDYCKVPALSNKLFYFLEGREISENGCYRTLALNKEDASICEKLDGDWYKSSCYSDLAIKLSRSSFCDAAPDKYKDDCKLRYARAKKDFSLCKDLAVDTYNRDSCFESMILQEKDPFLCANLSTVSKRDLCYDKLAVEKRDPSICNSIELEKNKEYCIVKTSRTK